jgi:hypothetical protein
MALVESVSQTDCLAEIKIGKSSKSFAHEDELIPCKQ